MESATYSQSLRKVQLLESIEQEGSWRATAKRTLVLQKFTSGVLVHFKEWWPLLHHQPMGNSNLMKEFFLVLEKFARLADPDDYVSAADKRTCLAFARRSFTHCWTRFTLLVSEFFIALGSNNTFLAGVVNGRVLAELDRDQALDFPEDLR